MNLFLVTLDNDASPEAVNSLVSQHYEDANYRLSSTAWVVAADVPVSTAEVGRKLGIEEETENNRQSGIVARIAEYSGYAHKSLWPLMRGWSGR